MDDISDSHGDEQRYPTHSYRSSSERDTDMLLNTLIETRSNFKSV